VGKDLFSPLFFPLRKRKEKQVHLLSPDEFRAENAHEEHTHTHIHTRTNFQAHFDRETEDTRTKLSYFSCFFVCIFQKGEKNSHVFVTKSGQNDGA
jgi:hypothetical protein